MERTAMLMLFVDLEQTEPALLGKPVVSEI